MTTRATTTGEKLNLLAEIICTIICIEYSIADCTAIPHYILDENHLHFILIQIVLILILLKFPFPRFGCLFLQDSNLPTPAVELHEHHEHHEHHEQ